VRTLLILIFVASACPAAPVVLWASDPVRPGETALVFGEGFERTTSIEVVRLDDGPPGDPPPPGSVVARGEAVTVEPIQPRPRSVKFVIPLTFRMGVYACRIRTDSGDAVAVLNRPGAIWLHGDAGPDATPGGQVRVFGRSLAMPRHQTVFLLRGQGRDRRLADFRKPTALEVRERFLPGTYSPSDWSPAADLPEDMTPGPYKLYAHNGCGGAAGWSAPLDLTVTPKAKWPSAQFSVRDFGARGTGKHDDTAAIQAAVAKAKESGGGVVYFPRGRYLLTEGIELPPRTQLRGEHRDLAAIVWPEMPKPPEFLIYGKKSFGVQKLTFYCTDYIHFLGNDLNDPEAGDVHIRNICVRADLYRGHLTPEQVAERFKTSLSRSTGGGDTLRLRGSDIEVEDCDLYGSGRVLYLTRGRGARIRHNTLYNGRWGWYCISGADGVVFEDNTLTGADLMSTGGGINCLDGSTCSQNVFFANNKLSLMHGWDREAMTSDAGGGAYCGGLASAIPTSVTLAEEPKWGGRDWRGAGVFILDGKGMGQYRRIVRTEGRRVDLDAPWTILPDGTSTVSLTMLQRNYFFMGNTFEDAGIAIQLYGMAIGCVMADNVSIRTGGFHNFGMSYHGLQPSWFNQWLGNVIEEGNTYRGGHDNYLLAGPAHLGVFALPPRTDWAHPLTLCTIVRGNELWSNAHIAIGGADPDNPALRHPLVQEVVVEGNLVRDSDVGIRLRRAAEGVFLRKNEFHGVTDEVLDDAEIERRAAERREKLMNLKEPVAYWKMDKAVGGGVPDESGHGFAARVEGKVRFEPIGGKGGCAVFDGASALRVATDDLIRFPKLTVAAWIRPDKIEGRQGIIAKRTHHAAAPFVLSVWDGGLEFEACEADNRTWSFNFRSPALIKAGVWQHVAAVVEEGKGVTLYLDGKPIASKVSDKPLAQNDEDIWIGKEAWGARKEDSNIPGCFTGAIREVKLWSRALSPDEIADLHR